jgi:type IV secretion system protein VirB6
MIMVLKVSGTMVSGWRVFGLVPDRHQSAQKAWVGAVQIAHHTARSPADPQPASSPDRSLSAIPFLAPPANDRDSITSAPRDVRTLRITDTADIAPRASDSLVPVARARGIGSRFRAPAPRLSEKRA